MKTYLAYVRVSTQRQFDTGTSLTEQRRSIEGYAGHHGLKVSRWFEEAESAASSGRTVFRHMLAELERALGTGLLLHKIDRGARNLRDWADLGELIDRGVDVRLTHEDLALDTRGGRLAADLQAVVAAGERYIVGQNGLPTDTRRVSAPTWQRPPPAQDRSWLLET